MLSPFTTCYSCLTLFDTERQKTSDFTGGKGGGFCWTTTKKLGTECNTHPNYLVETFQKKKIDFDSSF